MQIRLIDVEDDSERHAFYTIYRDSELADNPERPVWSEAEMMAHFTHQDAGEAAYPHAAFDDQGAMVGGASMFYPLLDNTSMVYAAICVAPAARRGGVGSALVDHVASTAAADGRTTLLVESTYRFDEREDGPYRRFAERRGFIVASTEVCRRLDLPLPDEQLHAWIEEAASHHAGYRIETFKDHIPDAVLPSMCHVLNQLVVDAPTGTLEFEPEQVGPEIFREREARNRRLGRQRYDTVAIDGSGTAVAVSTISLPPDDRTKAHQWATIVHKDHRGHRLGLALKAQNLRAVQRDHPERRSVHTCNEETNGPMVGINERMGFVPVELMVEFQLTLKR